MKKLIAVLCITLIIFMLTACSTNTSETKALSTETTVAEKTSNSEATKETTAESSEEIIFTIEDQDMMRSLEETSTSVLAEELFLGTPVTVDNMQFTLTSISAFLDQYTLDENNVYDVPDKDSYSFILAYFTLMNLGEEPINPSYINMELITNEGRTFPANRTWQYDADCINLDTLETGAWTATSPKLEAADGEREGVTVFQLPDKVLDSDASLELIITFKEKTYFYTIR